MHSLKVTLKNGTKFIRINGKYCDSTCDFRKKMFQGFGGWLGFEVDGCTILNGQLSTEKGKCIRCTKCMNFCVDQIEKNKVAWGNE